MGRKRKPGKREPNGKPSRRKADKQAMRTLEEQGTMQVARDARRRVHGVSVSDTGTDLAGSVVGRLYLAGGLTVEQISAANILRDVYASFQRAVDSPRPPRAVAIGEASGPSPRDVSEEAAYQAKSQWKAIERLLGKVNAVHRGSTIYAACYYVVLSDLDLPHLFPDMRIGLDAIAASYGLAARAA
jgi:hypothetical protein